MDIDLSVLRSLEREREISFDLLVDAIESALLLAYQRTEGAKERARVELDRTTGHVTVWATDDSDADAEADDTPTQPTRVNCASTTTRPRASAASPPAPRDR